MACFKRERRNQRDGKTTCGNEVGHPVEVYSPNCTRLPQPLHMPSSASGSDVWKKGTVLDQEKPAFPCGLAATAKERRCFIEGSVLEQDKALPFLAVLHTCTCRAAPRRRCSAAPQAGGPRSCPSPCSSPASTRSREMALVDGNMALAGRKGSGDQWNGSKKAVKR